MDAHSLFLLTYVTVATLYCTIPQQNYRILYVSYYFMWILNIAHIMVYGFMYHNPDMNKYYYCKECMCMIITIAMCAMFVKSAETTNKGSIGRRAMVAFIPFVSCLCVSVAIENTYKFHGDAIAESVAGAVIGQLAILNLHVGMQEKV